jgi:hypothetical protein
MYVITGLFLRTVYLCTQLASVASIYSIWPAYLAMLFATSVSGTLAVLLTLAWLGKHSLWLR